MSGCLLLDIHGRLLHVGQFGVGRCKIPVSDIYICRSGCVGVIILRKELLVDSTSRCRKLVLFCRCLLRPSWHVSGSEVSVGWR